MPGRIWRALQGATVLAVALVGLPVGLAYYPGWPLPRHVPTLAEAASLLQVTIPHLVDAFACLLWVGWAWLVVATLATVAARTGRLARYAAHIPVPYALRQAVAGVLGAGVIAVTTTTTGTAHPAAVPDAVAGHTFPPGSLALDRAMLVPAGQVTLLTADGRSVTYTVHRGDNLSHIARDWLGDADRWPEIYHLNKGRYFPVGGRLTNPNLIYPGWTLRLPSDGRPPASANGTTPKAATPPATAPVVPPPVDTSPSAPSSVGLASPTPAAAPGTSARSSGDHAGQRRGITLPSQGWISLAMAGGIAALAMALRYQQRRRARLRFPIPLRLVSTPPPLPASLRHAEAVGRQITEASPDGGTAIPTSGSTPIGVDPDGDDLRLSDLPVPLLALAGVGAQVAARGVLAAYLVAGKPDQAWTCPIVLTTTDLHERLLSDDLPGNATPTVSLEDRLAVLNDSAAALIHAEEEIIHRRRLLDTVGVGAHVIPRGWAQVIPQSVVLWCCST